MRHQFKKAADQNLQDVHLRKTLHKATKTSLEKRDKVVAEIKNDWQQLRELAHAIKAHTINNLDTYLLQLEDRLVDNGVQVFWAETAAEANNYIIEVIKKQNTDFVVKAKSMTSEEIRLNDALENAHITPYETDLGEYIVQLAHELPSHITAPALHKSRVDIAKLFHEKLNVAYTEDPQELTMIARKILRQKFLTAQVGISGVNFAVAENGTLVVVENEGNARLCMTLPKVHIAVMGIEKVIPKMNDLPPFLRILARSATGQKFSSYVSMIQGPHQKGVGPEEIHVVILDNGRSDLMRDPRFRQVLYCIRCGACLNACPIYQRVGGHAYGWVYPGPIGSVLTPHYRGLKEGKDLPFASSLCGRCNEVCPVKIELHHLLLWLRDMVTIENRRKNWGESLLMKFWEIGVRSSTIYEFGSYVMQLMPPSILEKWSSWGTERNFPKSAKQSFRQIWRQELSKKK